jgi:phosphopantothenoylcysteine decarboxylase/phosphopantothenate--cysteine ligase
MNLLITCGPAWEPLDGMRRLTNASTGRLGAALADAFATAGHRVTVFRGDMATAPLPEAPVELVPFGTNDELAGLLYGWSKRLPVHAIFHTAALCDFKPASVRSADGSLLASRKLSSRSGRLIVELEPATKVLPSLREWFPSARLVGWKYELDGNRDDALAAAWRQIRDASTDACVVNGAAWGPGFGLCEPPASVLPCADAADLAGALKGWLDRLPISRP